MDAAIVEPAGPSRAVADQACNGCRQRKARCDKTIPQCRPCARAGRHCLYQKQMRTPLTRKHMTELERRLRNAESLLRKARLQASLPADFNAARATQGVLHFTDAVDTSEEIEVTGLGSAPTVATPTAPSSQHAPILDDSVMGTPSSEHADFEKDAFYHSRAMPPIRIETRDLHRPNEEDDTLESPPDLLGDFEWDESNVRSPATTGVDRSQQDFASSASPESIGDGMATLAIDESQNAYFGVASGAALLRVIDPRAPDHSPRRENTSRPGAPARRGLSDMSMQLSFGRLITDTLIDAYFRYFHVSYPIIHEPTFRAQYAEVVERPNGQCWTFLAHIVAAIGAFTTSSDNTADNTLFAEAKSLMHVTYLENGNLTLVRALALMTNLLQKKDMPNSGYNYMGLATRMAMGIGLHKEFRGSSTSPFKMETRRRVWWCLTIFDVGAELTFGRPVLWPAGGFDVALPLNTHDWQLTACSEDYPSASQEITLYSALRVYGTLYLAIVPIYARMTSKPFVSAEELITLDDEVLGTWYSALPPYFAEYSQVPWKHRLSHSVMLWKYRNFKILMYRPFVVPDMLRVPQGNPPSPAVSKQVQDRCLHEARLTIASIEEFWHQQEHTRLGAWYALYFLFQAALIPCICLRSRPDSPQAGEWQEQVQTTLSVMKLLGQWTNSSQKCCDVLWKLCGEYLSIDPGSSASEASLPTLPTNEFYSTIWPSIYPIEGLEGDMAMETDIWTNFPQERT